MIKSQAETYQQAYNKQNIRPLENYSSLDIEKNKGTVYHRQGKGFRLDLGLNNGPFLPQDVTPLNQKSRHLLAARQILESHISMSSLLQQLQTKQNYMMKSLPSSLPAQYKIQNFTAQFSFLSDNLATLQQQSNKLRTQELKLKNQIRQCYEKFTNHNEQVVGMCAPIFKNLLKTVRNHHELQKNSFEQDRKNIDGLIRFRSVFLDKIIDCEKIIMNMQQFLGVKTSGDNEDWCQSLLKHDKQK